MDGERDEPRVRAGAVKSLEADGLRRPWITSEECLIDFNPILAGQTSPFSCLVTSNPAMSRFSVQFKELFGGTILTDDRR